ncbi:MAG: DNA-processing protein DprA, partial [Pseudomonadota bacterium]
MAPEDATPPPSPAVAASEGAAALRGQNGAGKAPAAPPQDAWSTSAAAPMASGEPGTTVAVLPGGIDVIYPPENAGLAERIVAAGGALISECAPGTEPTSRHFPRSAAAPSLAATAGEGGGVASSGDREHTSEL